ncbi:MAG: glycosyltransferase [Desulforhopalus sp.]
MLLLLILSWIALSTVIVSSVTIGVGVKKMMRLDDTKIADPEESPLVSVIIPACNEENHIEKSLMSLLSQVYKKLEIIVVNDRSRDNTGKILNEMKRRFPQLIIHEISCLPDGWMGKSYALSRGAQLAKGEYLVFTDADVILEKTTIARAVWYMTDNRLGHLTLAFKNITQGWLLNCLIIDAALGLLAVFRPWMAKKDSSHCFIGIGAFNMVRRVVYQEIGGHEEIKMHPVDDMMLGKIIKEQGFSQDCLLAYNFVLIPWYDSVSAMISGLEKNMFALVHYRIVFVLLLLLGIVVASILPFWGAIFGDNYLQSICFIALCLRCVTFYQGLRLQGLPWWFFPGCIITPYISCYIVLNSAIVTIRNGGIIWRGQRYPLDGLIKTRPLLL